MRVLLVDDEVRILEALERSLDRLEGWELTSAEGGVQALAKLDAEGPFDALVTDMRMPGMDGNELLRHVVRRSPETVRIVLTGFVAPEGAEEAQRIAHRYLHKPCGPDTLHEAIETSVRAMRRMHSDAMRAAIGAVSTLPPAPKIFLELQALLAEPHASIEQAAALVARDPALTIKCLQMANSAFSSRGGNVRDVKQAVARLGLRALSAVALSTSLHQAASKLPTVRGLDVTAHQARAEQIGELARKLAGGQPFRHEAYTAGLVVDAGLLVMALRMPRDVERILAEHASTGVSLVELERAAWGVSHAEVGAVLLEVWGLPTPIVTAVATHHEPAARPEAPISLEDAVRIAVAVTDAPTTHAYAALLEQQGIALAS